jgi:hypothetical protein
LWLLLFRKSCPRIAPVLLFTWTLYPLGFFMIFQASSLPIHSQPLPQRPTVSSVTRASTAALASPRGLSKIFASMPVPRLRVYRL